MREVLDIRVWEDWASKHLPGVGKHIPHTLTRKIRVDPSDPVVQTIRQRVLDYERRTGEYPITSAFVSRYYDTDDLRRAELLLLCIKCLSEVYGAQFGTQYDDSATCPKCGAGRTQVSPLILDTTKLAKHCDLVETLADEWVVSSRLADVIRREEITGCDLRRVEDAGSRRQTQWHQLAVLATSSRHVAPTKFGIDYFREGDERQVLCYAHGLYGLNLLSELYIGRDSKPQTDISRAECRCGRFADWMLPHPLLLISPHFAEILRVNKIKGYDLGVVHVV